VTYTHGQLEWCTTIGEDFWLEDARAQDVDATSSTFDADFAHAEVTSQAGGLGVEPGSTSALVGLIDSAKRSLLVENEEMDSTSIESALAIGGPSGCLVRS